MAQDEFVAVDASWKRFEKQIYRGTQDVRTYANRELTEEENFPFITTIEVLEASDSHFLVNSKTERIGFSKISTAYEFSNYLEDIGVLCKTDEKGEFIEVDNRDYVLGIVEKQWMDTFGHLGDVTWLQEFWQDKLDSYKSGEDLDLSLSGELYMLLFLHGYELPIGEVVEFESYIPGYGVYDNIPAMAELEFKSVRDGVLKAQVEFQMDEEAFKSVVEDVVEEIVASMFGMEVPNEAKEEIRRALRSLEVSRRMNFEVDLESGWVLDYRDRTTTIFEGEKTISMLKMVLEQEEE